MRPSVFVPVMIALILVAVCPTGASGESDLLSGIGGTTVIGAATVSPAGQKSSGCIPPSWQAESAWGWLDWFRADGEAVTLYLKWVVGAPILVVVIILAMLLRPRRKPPFVPPLSRRPRRAEGSGVAKPSARVRPQSSRPIADFPNLSGQQQILRFFLHLFKCQQGADDDALAQIYLVETRATCPNETYEMRIQHHDEWLTRRMSIGLLGQGGGSRSQCFYVIYDTHMVIKIPAVKITRFGDYKRQMAAEGRILARLAPWQCIVPRVSVIMRAVHAFEEGTDWTEEVLESRYMDLLESQPELQAHLKIGDSFVLFMDLAKHFFLSTTLAEIHGGYGRLIDEARKHPELLWDQHGFICRYGEEAGTVCQALQDVYSRCEGRLQQIVSQTGASQELPTYHLKQWFLSHLVGDTVHAGVYSLLQTELDQINQLLSGVIEENRGHVTQYRKHLLEYIKETRFTRYRRQVEGLATNILELLAWMGQKGLAMRDLKPENLFVAGPPDEYPAFLNNPEKFSIGLIDVETAVIIDAADPVLIVQPQLAGTPLYATPAHLIPNAILLEVYEDLSHILHLQDWHAAIAILFKLITGENLFAASAHVFPEILKRLKVLDPTGVDLAEEVIRIQRLFWNSAVAEFEEGMHKHAGSFARLDISVPSAFAGQMAASLKNDIDEIKRAVARAVREQSFFTSGDKRRYLKEASAEKITQMKHRLAQGNEMQKDPLLLYLEIFERLKTQLEVKERALAALIAPSAALGADHLMAAMFQHVFTSMYPPHWPMLTPAVYGRRTLLEPDMTTYQVTM